MAPAQALTLRTVIFTLLLDKYGIISLQKGTSASWRAMDGGEPVQ